MLATSVGGMPTTEMTVNAWKISFCLVLRIPAPHPTGTVLCQTGEFRTQSMTAGHFEASLNDLASPAGSMLAHSLIRTERYVASPDRRWRLVQPTHMRDSRHVQEQHAIFLRDATRQFDFAQFLSRGKLEVVAAFNPGPFFVRRLQEVDPRHVACGRGYTSVFSEAG
jgi:hypothetical protein